MTNPPSWSTAIRSLRWSPSAAARCSLVVIARSPAAEPKLWLKMMTPPILPWRTRRSRDSEGLVPSMLTTSFWPIICRSDGAEAGAASVEVPEAGSVLMAEVASPVEADGPAAGTEPESPVPPEQPATIETTARTEVSALVMRRSLRGIDARRPSS